MAAGMQGHLIYAMGHPCMVPVARGTKEQVLRLTLSWVCAFGPPPCYLLGFDSPNTSRTHLSAQCQECAALEQVVVRASLLLIHIAHFILVLFLLGLNQPGTDVNRLVISC